jgi:hypothetical protein
MCQVEEYVEVIIRVLRVFIIIHNLTYEKAIRDFVTIPFFEC